MYSGKVFTLYFVRNCVHGFGFIRVHALVLRVLPGLGAGNLCFGWRTVNTQELIVRLHC